MLLATRGIEQRHMAILGRDDSSHRSQGLLVAVLRQRALAAPCHQEHEEKMPYVNLACHYYLV